MTDWRRLCEELLGSLENEGHAHWPGGPDGDPLIERARALLGQPEPEVVALSGEELSELALDVYGNRCGTDEDFARAAIAADRARWGRAALSQPEGAGVGPTDEELESDFRAWWKERYGESYFGAAPLVSVIDWAKHAIARFGGRPALAPAGEVAELVDALRADAECAEVEHYDLCNMTADQMRRVADLLERQAAPVPVAVSDRLPQPEDCDAEGRCWMGYWEDEINGLGHLRKTWFWTLEDLSMVDEHTHWLPHHALPKPSGEVG